jgi:phosphoglycerate dehydrogenase-like enzyme
MAILVLPTSRFVELQLEALRALAPEVNIYTDPATAPPAEIEAMLAFRLTAGVVPRFSALRFIGCAGAGADDVLATPDIPATVAITRVVDPLQGVRMAQYVTLMVLRAQRDLSRLEAQSREGTWQRRAPFAEEDYAVGVMGYGATAVPLVDVLARLGYPVAVWTRTARSIDGVATFAGAEGLAPFLARTHVLVCALPLTGETRGLLAAPLFAALPKGAHVINVSRGAVLNEADLVAAVDVGQLGGAALDVFEVEPLPAASPLWRHPRILCTPHIAAVPRPATAAAQFLANLRRARRGEPLANVVDRARGY